MNTVQGEKDLRRDRKQILYYTVFNLRNFVSFSYLGIEIHQSNFLFLGQSVSSGVRSITISTLVLSIFLYSKHAAKAQNPQKAVNRSSRFRRCTVVCNIEPVKLAAVCTFPSFLRQKNPILPSQRIYIKCHHLSETERTHWTTAPCYCRLTKAPRKHSVTLKTKAIAERKSNQPNPDKVTEVHFHGRRHKTRHQ